MFNEDLEANLPKEWVALGEKIHTDDGFLFLTPKYNRSMPGVFKNAIDMGSRPYGENSWNVKPVANVRVSIGAISGFGANHHLRQSMVFVNVAAMAQPEAYIGGAGELFDDNGKLTNESTKDFLKTYLRVFDKLTQTNA